MTKSDAGGPYRSFYMSVVNDGEKTELTQVHYKNTGNFSGRILFYSLKGELINGWSYNEGTIVQSISAGTKKTYDETRSKRIIMLNMDGTGTDGANGKISRAYWPGECHTETITTYGVSCVTVATYTNCTLYQTGTTYLTYCTEGEGGGGGGVGNPPGGGGGSGGDDGDEQIPVDTLNKLTDTCLKKAIKMALDTGIKNDFKSIMQNTIL